MSEPIRVETLYEVKPNPGIPSLIAWFEDNFSCFVGPPRALFHVPVAKGVTKAIVYDSYGIRTCDMENAEERLCEEFRRAFEPLLQTDAQGTLLVWRLEDKIQIERGEEQLYGEVLATREEVQDNLKPQPEGAVLDEVFNWREDAGRRPYVRLRTRLALPALEWEEYQPWYRRIEGAPEIIIPTLPLDAA